eukprot:gene17406-19149_t
MATVKRSEVSLRYLVVILSFGFILNVYSLPEAGKATLQLSESQKYAAFKKVLFRDTKIDMLGFCTSKEKESPKMILVWKLKYSTCTETFLNIKPSEGAFAHSLHREVNGEIIGESKVVSCHEINHVSIADITKQKNNSMTVLPTVQNDTSAKLRRSNEATKKEDEATKKEDEKTKKTPSELRSPWSGAYMLILKVVPFDEQKKFHLEVKVDVKSKRGYLSATEWPLLPFFGVLSLVYLGYAIGWLVASCYNWRDLLRIQFWIGAVIALGMLEKALFYSEYQNVNITGEESNGLVIFAELVSCLKRTLARILVIIVSMGFGIVKPRLGAALPKVLAAGLLFFILASVEGCLRALSPKAAPSKQQMIAAIPLVVLDSILCWWISFQSLVQTTRTLRIRKNLVKLSLYRHFTNTLIFGVIASIIYMAWSIKSHTFSGCTDWSEVWFDEAFWPFLFSLILLVIMVLWRPTNNNQRYAFTPLLDLSDDEEDPALSDAYDGMKLRGFKKDSSNGNLKNRSVDDDLRWVEENIPSIPSTVLPSLDSDEEIMTTKLEMSKMD